MDLTRAVLLMATILSIAPFHAQAQQAIYIVRHAEQVRGVADPPLTADGRQRARALADILRDSGITAVYSSEALRTRQTAQPTADALGLKVRQVPREKTAELIARIRAEGLTGRVLVVGHSETVPQILRGLGHPEQITIDRSDYGNIFVVVPNGTPKPLVLRQQLAPAAPGIFGAILPEPTSETPNLSTEELKRVLADRSAVLLDNRPFKEYALGHIPGALNVAPKPGMPMSQYTSDVAEVGRLLGGDKTRAIVLYCAGPFCGKSKRVADDLLAAGYTNVRRYQLGAPVWRALGGPMVMEAEGVRHVIANDRTAWLIDAREPEAFRAGSLPEATNVWAGEVKKAKDDGRVPMEDHNTRLIVFGQDRKQARGVAEELTRNAFHNVSYFEGGIESLRAALAHRPAGAPRVVRTAAVQAPARGEMTQETVHEGERMVSRIMRLSPGAAVAEHHHPSFEETFVVQSGSVQLSLDDKVHELRAGDVVYIPAGTVISGKNGGRGEAVVIVTWANNGRSGPLTVSGRPAEHH